MVVVDWLQTCEFLRENSDRFVLYALCGGLIGVIIILLSIILVLYVELRFRPSDSDDDSSSAEPDYELNRTYLPVYRYNDRVQQDFYQLSS